MVEIGQNGSFRVLTELKVLLKNKWSTFARPYRLPTEAPALIKVITVPIRRGVAFSWAIIAVVQQVIP